MAVPRRAATDGLAVPISPGDPTIGWARRPRPLTADTWNAGNVPLPEISEAHVVEILDRATRK